MRALLISLLAFCAISIHAQAGETTKPMAKADVFSSTNCMGCHGQSAMGGLGPPIAKTKVVYDEFLKTVRTGKGMMPATTTAMLPDDKVRSVYDELQEKPYIESQIPVAFKVAQLLTTESVSHLFLAVFSFATIMALWGLRYWLRCAGLKELLPYAMKFGLFRSIGVVLRALIVDGLLVASLWRTNRFRWLMHGLMLYGMMGLLLADVLLSIYNPSRGDLALTNPLKLLPVLSGIAVFTGVLYVMFRYKRDTYEE